MATTETYLVFKKYTDASQAAEMLNLLKENGIQAKLSDNSAPVDVTFSGNTHQDDIQLKIRPDDFLRANNVLEAQAENLLEDVDPDHYLFQFDDDELMEVLEKADEWSPYDFILAQHILSQRGKEVPPGEVASMKKRRMEALSEPEPFKPYLYFLAYISAALGGFFGILIGWHIRSAQRTLPNGERVAMYSPSDQRRGHRLFVTGFVFLALWLALGIAMLSL